MAGKVTLKAPFSYFGAKSAVAEIVWGWLGDVDNYIESFCGSAAVLLGRPARHTPRYETVNDKDAHLANVWRALRADPERVAEYADWPVSEADLTARHRWLVCGPRSAEFRRRMLDDPDYFDPQFAGWWIWGACLWIGGGWCRVDEADSSRPPPAGCRPQLTDAHALGRGVHANDKARTCQERRGWLKEWFVRLADRLRQVRVLCGDWLRACGSPSVTTRLGKTGVFLDPPYSAEAKRSQSLYAVEDLAVAHDVRRWCLDRGDDPGMRIVLCGLAGEGHEELEGRGWTVTAWKPNGGYGNRNKDGNQKSHRERMWASPHCVRERTLFDG